MKTNVKKILVATAVVIALVIGITMFAQAAERPTQWFGGVQASYVDSVERQNSILMAHNAELTQVVTWGFYILVALLAIFSIRFLVRRYGSKVQEWTMPKAE